jgi:DNA-binding NarL/FixJ family response regulator
MTKIIVVEPHALLRLGLLQLLSDLSPGVHLEGAEYSSFTREPKTQSCDMVLLSVYGSEQTTKLIAAAQAAYSPKSIVLLAENESMLHALHGLPDIVAGYVTKCAEPGVLQASLRLVLAGGTCFPLRTAPAPAAPNTASVAPPAPRRRGSCEESQMLGITPRQYEVLVLLARGYPLKTVGRYLNISVATAKAHTETLYQRLNVHSRNAAVYAAVSRGAKLGWPSIGGVPDPSLNESGKSGTQATLTLFPQDAAAGFDFLGGQVGFIHREQQGQ